jgi:hypothetical protein
MNILALHLQFHKIKLIFLTQIMEVHMKKVTLFSALLVAVVFTSLFVSAGATEEKASRLYGRDYVSMGTLGVLSGVLFEENDEWYLKANNGTYALHIGNHSYREETGIDLKADKNIDVTGFIYKNDVSVCTIVIEGKEYRFRDDDGRPKWAGRGRGRNRNNHDNGDKPSWSGRGQGNRRNDNNHKSSI